MKTDNCVKVSGWEKKINKGFGWKELINSLAILQSPLQNPLPFILLSRPEPSSSGSSHFVCVTNVITVFYPASIYPSLKHMKENFTQYSRFINGIYQLIHIFSWKALVNMSVQCNCHFHTHLICFFTVAQ